MPAYFFIHSLLLLLVFVLPKVLKVQTLGGVDPLWVLSPDLLAILFAEGVLFFLCWLSPKKVARFLAVVWGLFLIPLMLFALAEHRFFTASGSLLDLKLLQHGLGKFSEIHGVVGAELSPIWVGLMVLTVPLGLGVAAFGWKQVEGQGRWLGLPLSFLSLLALSGTAFWSGPSNVDPRVVSIAVNWASLMAMDGLRVRAWLREPPKENLNLAYPIPATVVLSAPEGTNPVNVVVVILESVRAQATTPYNEDLNTSPFLKELADTGWRVENAYTTIPHTTKSLVPILCGIPPDVRRPLTETLPGALPVSCLPQLLRPLGYRSAFFQSATKQFEQRPITVQNMGFQDFVSREDLDRTAWEHPNYLGLEDRAMLKPALDWIGDAGEDREPFVMTLLTLITHHDYKLPSTFESVDYGGASDRINRYFNTVRYTDDFLRDFVEGLRERGQLDNTLIVVIGDHGEGHGEHGRMGHDAILNDEGIKVPMVLWSPKLLGESRVISQPRQNSDLLPTLVDVMGLEVETGSFWGRSLTEDVSDRSIFFSCWYGERCIGSLQGHKKLIYYYTRYPMAYFDLEKDPDERENLIGDLSSEMTKEKIAEMLAWKFDVRSMYATHHHDVLGEYIYFERPAVEHGVEAKFGSKLHALGYGLSGPQSVGMPFLLDVYFEVESTVGWQWKFDLKLMDSMGISRVMRCISSDARFPGYTWVPGQFHRLKISCQVPSTANAGPGHLLLSLRGSGKRIMPVKGPGANKDQKALMIPIVIK